MILGNKDGRLDRIGEKVDSIRKSGGGSRHEKQELHGLMNFACGFFAGRALRMAGPCPILVFTDGAWEGGVAGIVGAGL